MTDLNVSLSTALQTELDQAGIWAYAVYFDANGAHWSTLVSNGTVENGGTTPISLPEPYASGKVYFIIQSQASTDPNDLPTLITTQSGINWGNATSYDFAYDSFEVTLQNSPDDVGNLSSINGYGLPMAVSIPYDNDTTASVGYNISASALVSDIQAINPANTYTYNYTSGPLSSDFRMAAAPAVAATNPSPVPNPPFQPTDWTDYVTSLEGAQAENIVLSGVYNGAHTAATSGFPNGVWSNGGYFAYQLQWDATDKDFWLVPLASSQIKGDIQITPASLEDSIYATNGSVNIYTNMTDQTPFESDMNTGANTQWGKVLSEFLTGFTGGFYGQTGVPLNPQVTGPINLDQNINWDPSYAFQQNVTGSPPAYQADDPYSKIFYNDSNSYGSGYSDALMSQYAVGGPQIGVSEPDTGQNVPNINLTIFAPGETPSGYTKPVIYNYIAPDGTYAVPNSTPAANNIKLTFAVTPPNTPGVVLPSTATITLNVLTSDAGDVPTWSTVTFDGATAGGAGLWQNWNITFDSQSSQYTATPTGVAQPAGTILMGGFPTAVPTSGTATSWYQIGVGSKTFNLYTTTNTSGGFINQTGSLAVDGLAQVMSASANTLSVNFAVGSTVAVDPSELILNTAAARVADLAQPFCPVAGTLSTSDDVVSFTALPGQNNNDSNTITTTDSQIAFAWTGENNAPGTGGWVGSYTNLIAAENVALVTITPTTGSPITTEGTANIDGQWQTGTVDLGLGTYTITMQEFAPTDTSFTTPLSKVSEPLMLTEACFAAGTRIGTEHGEIAVEQIMVGDQVRVVLGEELAPVIWVGRREVDCTRHPHPESVWPVRVRAGAFGPRRPHRDLYLSPDHAVYVNDVLIPIKHLINGSSILQVPVARVTYHHLELAAHDVLLAEGLPAESFLDLQDGSNYANRPGPVRLYPDFSARAWEAFGCAPLVVAGVELEAVRVLLEGRARRRSAVDERVRRWVGLV